MSKKIMITGASGFLGKPVLDQLIKKDYEIYAIYNSAAPSKLWPHEKIIWHNCNLLDAVQTGMMLDEIKPDYLIHLAWDVAPGYRDSNNNVAWLYASLNLMHRFSRAGGKRVIIAGTCFEYDLHIKDSCNEFTGVLNPNTLYGVCKNSLFSILNTTKFANSIEIVWGRIFYPYGPNEYPTRLIPYIINSILNNNIINLKSPTNYMRPFMYTEDIARAFVQLLEFPFVGAVNITTTEINYTQTIINKIASLLDRNFDDLIINIENSSIEPLLINSEPHVLNSFNFKPEFNIDRGLMKTINWWKEYNKLIKECRK